MRWTPVCLGTGLSLRLLLCLRACRLDTFCLTSAGASWNELKGLTPSHEPSSHSVSLFSMYYTGSHIKCLEMRTFTLPCNPDCLYDLNFPVSHFVSQLKSSARMRSSIKDIENQTGLGKGATRSLCMSEHICMCLTPLLPRAK